MKINFGVGEIKVVKFGLLNMYYYKNGAMLSHYA